MNPSRLVFVINDHVRGIMASYEPDYSTSKGPSSGPALFKTMDPSIKKDDLIIVPTSTRHGFTICKVTEADVFVDSEAPEEISWIAGKVDIVSFDKQLADEKEGVEKIQTAEKMRRRSELRASLLTSGAISTEIKALPIYDSAE